MSLKQFHLVFIAASLGLFGFLMYWSGQRLLAGQDHLGSAVAAGAGLIAGIVYLGWFLRKYKAIH